MAFFLPLNGFKQNYVFKFLVCGAISEPELCCCVLCLWYGTITVQLHASAPPLIMPFNYVQIMCPPHLILQTHHWSLAHEFHQFLFVHYWYILIHYNSSMIYVRSILQY
jgi:hypothetical protein